MEQNLKAEIIKTTISALQEAFVVVRVLATAEQDDDMKKLATKLLGCSINLAAYFEDEK